MIYSFLSYLFAGRYPEPSLVFELLSKSIYSPLITVNFIAIIVLSFRNCPWLRKFSYRKRMTFALVIAIASILMSILLYMSFLGVTRFSQDIFDRCKLFDYHRNPNVSPIEDTDYRIVFSCNDDGKNQKSFLEGADALFYDMYFLNNQINRDCVIVKEPKYVEIVIPGSYSCGEKTFSRFPFKR